MAQERCSRRHEGPRLVNPYATAEEPRAARSSAAVGAVVAGVAGLVVLGAGVAAAEEDGTGAVQDPGDAWSGPGSGGAGGDAGGVDGAVGSWPSVDVPEVDEIVLPDAVEPVAGGSGDRLLFDAALPLEIEDPVGPLPVDTLPVLSPSVGTPLADAPVLVASAEDDRSGDGAAVTVASGLAGAAAELPDEPIPAPAVTTGGEFLRGAGGSDDAVGPPSSVPLSPELDAAATDPWTGQSSEDVPPGGPPADGEGLGGDVVPSAARGDEDPGRASAGVLSSAVRVEEGVVGPDDEDAAREPLRGAVVSGAEDAAARSATPVLATSGDDGSVAVTGPAEQVGQRTAGTATTVSAGDAADRATGDGSLPPLVDGAAVDAPLDATDRPDLDDRGPADDDHRLLADQEGVLVAVDPGSGSDTPMDLGFPAGPGPRGSNSSPAEPLGRGPVDTGRIDDPWQRGMVEFAQGAGADLLDLVLNGEYDDTEQVGEALRIFATSYPEFLECGPTVSCITSTSPDGVTTIVPGSATVGPGRGGLRPDPLRWLEPDQVPADTTSLGLVTVKPPRFDSGTRYADNLPGLDRSDLVSLQQLRRRFPDTPITGTVVNGHTADTVEVDLPRFGWPEPGEYRISNPLGLPVSDQWWLLDDQYPTDYPAITLTPGTTVAPLGTSSALFESLFDGQAAVVDGHDRHEAGSGLALFDLENLDPAASDDEIQRVIRGVVSRSPVRSPEPAWPLGTPLPDPWDAVDPTPAPVPPASTVPLMPGTTVLGLLPPAGATGGRLDDPVDAPDPTPPGWWSFGDLPDGGYPDPAGTGVDGAIRGFAADLGLSLPGEDAPPPARGGPAVTYAVRPGTTGGEIATALRLYTVDGIPVGDPPAGDELVLQLDTDPVHRTPRFSVVGPQQIDLFDGGLHRGRDEVDQQHAQLTSESGTQFVAGGAPLPALLPDGVTATFDGPWSTPDPRDATSRLWVGGRPGSWVLRDGETGWLDDGQVGVNLSFADGACVTITCSGAATLTGAPRVLGDDGVGTALVDADGRAPVSFAPWGTVGWSLDPSDGQQPAAVDGPGGSTPEASGGRGDRSGGGLFAPPEGGYLPDFGANEGGVVFRPPPPDPAEQRRRLEEMRPRPQPRVEWQDLWVFPPTASSPPAEWQEQWPTAPTDEEREAMQHTPPFPGAQPQAPREGETLAERLARLGVMTWTAAERALGGRPPAPAPAGQRSDARAGGADRSPGRAVVPATGASPALVPQAVQDFLTGPATITRSRDGRTYTAAGGVPFTPWSYVGEYDESGALVSVRSGQPPARINTAQYMDPVTGALVAAAAAAPGLAARLLPAASTSGAGLSTGWGAGAVGLGAMVPLPGSGGLDGLVDQAQRVGRQVWDSAFGRDRPSAPAPAGGRVGALHVGDGTPERAAAANRYNWDHFGIVTNFVGNARPAAPVVRPPAPAVVEQVRDAAAGVARQPVVQQVQRAVQEATAPVVRQVQEATAPVVRQVQEATAPVVRQAQEAAAPIVHQVQEAAGRFDRAVVQPVVREAQHAIDQGREALESGMRWLTGGGGR